MIIYEPSGSDLIFLEPAGSVGRLATEPLEFRLVAAAIGRRSLGEGLNIDQALDIAFLHEAGLDRDNRIDRAGLNFWIDAREDGLGYVDIARSFLASEDFTASYGTLYTLSDRALAEALYANVFDREGEAAGTDF